jgi:arabinan endo-1,5-alpha-L-arabinosidase
MKLAQIESSFDLDDDVHGLGPRIEKAAESGIQPRPRIEQATDAPKARGSTKPGVWHFRNPVVATDCPDPAVVAVDEADGRRYYAVCTGGRFAIRTSRDLITWHDTGAFILPSDKPPWAANGERNWAPELHRVGDRWIAYFTSVDQQDRLCIGTAVAASPTGPYTVSAAPLVQDPQGVIDANFFEDDDGRRFLIYKIDGNAFGNPTPIYIRELAPDGLSFAPGSSPTQILVNDAGTWEGGVVEGPWLVKRADHYFLFYSGNVYDHRYRTGVARSKSVLGPYEKHGQPILGINSQWVGPGHGSVVTVGGSDFFVYHAWLNDGSDGHVAAAGRQMLVDRIIYANGWPAIGGGSPTTSLQPFPE